MPAWRTEAEAQVGSVVGPVENTIPDAAPDEIAVLRLDTDYEASTRHEMEHLFPRLVPGGVLIVDDYGFFQGARAAVDEYLDANDIAILLDRIDDSGRIAVIPGRET
jgi:O-methyltransferase